jgi:hypothetical protein
MNFERLEPFDDRRRVDNWRSSADTPTAATAPVPVSKIAPRLLADWREKWKPDDG